MPSIETLSAGKYGRRAYMKLRDTTQLRTIMKAAGLSVRGLAEQCECSKTFIGALLTGDRDGCSAPLAILIAATLGCEVSDLFTARVSVRVRPKTHPARQLASVA